MTKLDTQSPLSVWETHSGRRGSSSPSKIPYVGFSPVRLQTGLSGVTFVHLAGVKRQAHIPHRLLRTYTRPTTQHPAPVAPKGKCSGASRQGHPVQRSLARQRVMLSRRVIAYYDLIRASRALPPIYVLDGGSSPYGLVWAESERFPNLLRMSVPSVPRSVPRWTERVLLAISSPAPSSLRLLCTDSASTVPHPSVLAWAA